MPPSLHQNYRQDAVPPVTEAIEKELVVGDKRKRECGRNLGEIFRMTNIRYTNAQRLKALQVFGRTQSATKTVRELGYPGRWTLHRWIRQRREPPSPPIRRTTLKRYPLTTKLKAVELFNSGMSPDVVAVELSLNSKMSLSCLGPTIPCGRKAGLDERN